MKILPKQILFISVSKVKADPSQQINPLSRNAPAKNQYLPQFDTFNENNEFH